MSSKYVCNDMNCRCEFNVPDKIGISHKGYVEIIDVCPSCNGFNIELRKEHNKNER